MFYSKSCSTEMIRNPRPEGEGAGASRSSDTLDHVDYMYKHNSNKNGSFYKRKHIRNEFVLVVFYSRVECTRNFTMYFVHLV